MCADQSRDKTNQRKKLKESNLGIRAQVSDAQAIAFSFPHQATALQKKGPPIFKVNKQFTCNIRIKLAPIPGKQVTETGNQKSNNNNTLFGHL